MPFDPSKKYKEMDFKEGQFVASQDFNLTQALQNYDKRELQKFFQGFQLRTHSITNAPVLKVKANYDLDEGQVITIEMVDAVTARWRKNDGAWSAGIGVTCDNVTWNTLGTSGLDVVFRDTAIGSDESEVWVAQAIRLLGGEIDSPAAGTFRLNEGRWGILGEYEEFDTPMSVAGCNDGDYLYLRVERNAVDYTADNTIGHRLADGQYSSVSPDAIDREYTLMNGAVFPDNVASPYTEYIIVGKVISAAGGTFVEMWENPQDVQKMLRIYGDTTPPIAPTGLSLSTGSDSGFVEATIFRNVPSIPIHGFLTMSCDINPEPDIDYYEFKVTRLDSIGGALTTDTFTKLVPANTDDGGVGIPIGVSYTEHSLLMGVPYRVWVRAIDLAGNVGAWSASEDEVIGGTGTIAPIDPGPTFTIIDPEGFVGFEIAIGGLPAGAAGFTIWVQNDSYPTVTSADNAIGSYDANVGTVRIPWNERSRPHVRMKAYDENGIFQAGTSEDNISLSADSQLAVQIHNEAPTAHSGIIGDLQAITERYGSFNRFATLISSQGFDIRNVYIVAQEGGFYSTIQAALDTISLDAPQRAMVLVAPGTYPENAAIVWPSGMTTAVTVQSLGQNRAVVVADWELSNLGWSPVPFAVSGQFLSCGLTLRDLILPGEFTGTNTGAIPLLLGFDNCMLVPNTAGPAISLNGTAGSCSLFIRNSILVATVDIEFVRLNGNGDLYLDNSQLVTTSETGVNSLIRLIGPFGDNLVVKGSMFQVSNSTTGLWITSDAPVSVHAFHNVVNTAEGADVTLLTGSADTNTTIVGDYLYQ